MRLVLFSILLCAVGLKANFIPSHAGSRNYGFNFGSQAAFNIPSHPHPQIASHMLPTASRFNAQSFGNKPTQHFYSSPGQSTQQKIRTLSGTKPLSFGVPSLIAANPVSVPLTPPPTTPAPPQKICFAMDDLPVLKSRQNDFYKPTYKATFEYVANGGLFYPYGSGRYLYATTPAPTTTTTAPATTTAAPATTTAASATSTAQAPTTTPGPSPSTKEVCFELNDLPILKSPMKSEFYLPTYQSTQVPTSSFNGFNGYGGFAPPIVAAPLQPNPYLTMGRPGYY